MDFIKKLGYSNLLILTLLATNNASIHIIIGSKDDVVNPRKTLQFLSNLLKQKQDYKIRIRQDLEHRIPLDVFEEEVMQFMKDF